MASINNKFQNTQEELTFKGSKVRKITKLIKI